VQAAPSSGGPTSQATENPVSPPAAVAGNASAPFRAVVEQLRAAMAELGVPGAAIGILGGGREEHAVLGVASVETGETVMPDTLFQIGSLTKSYTATAILRLSEAGKLDLDAPVRGLLPHLRPADEPAAAEVTVRHLLTHTGGWWGDYFSDSGDGDDAIERFVATDLPTLMQLAPVGAHFSYNNAGFILLGRLIEVVTGQRYRADAPGDHAASATTRRRTGMVHLRFARRPPGDP
jgi:CubicO group peptidase (beta-lactamase class C family)